MVACGIGETVVLCKVKTDGVYCSQSCMYRIFMLFKRRLPNYQHAKRYIEYLHELMNPGKPLQPAPDPDLLDTHGGSMTREEYDATLHSWQLSPNTLLIPIRLQHLHKKE